MSLVQRMVVATAMVSACALAIGCSSDDEGSSTSSSGGSSTSSSGGSSTSSSGGSTTSSSSGETCTKQSLCINGACKCTAGPNKDQPCEDEGTGADGCDTFCRVCTSE